MPSRRPVRHVPRLAALALAVACLLVGAGCATGGPPATASAGSRSKADDGGTITTAVSETVTTDGSVVSATNDTGADTPAPCTAEPAYPSVRPPARPDEMSSASTKDAAVAYEGPYRRAAIAASADLEYYRFLPNDVTASEVDGGYRVEIRYYVEYGTSGGPNGTALDAHRPFTARYTVTARSIDREGTRVACW